MGNLPKSHYRLKSGNYFVPDMAVMNLLLATPDDPAPKEMRKELFSYGEIAITLTGTWDDARNSIVYTLAVNPDDKADEIKPFIVEDASGTVFSIGVK